jgi:mono/diheme cytochrome c family protein
MPEPDHHAARGAAAMQRGDMSATISSLARGVCRSKAGLILAAAVFIVCHGSAAVSTSQETQAPAARSVVDGVYTEEQAKRGGPLYAQQCASCHGQSLEGTESAPTLNGDAFMSNWSGLTVGDLFERIRLTMPKNDPGHLSPEQNADLLAYILQVNRLPPGKTELPSEPEVLKQITFDAAKTSKAAIRAAEAAVEAAEIW